MVSVVERLAPWHACYDTPVSRQEIWKALLWRRFRSVLNMGARGILVVYKGLVAPRWTGGFLLQLRSTIFRDHWWCVYFSSFLRLVPSGSAICTSSRHT